MDQKKVIQALTVFGIAIAACVAYDYGKNHYAKSRAAKPLVATKSE